jgi:hypothetical protein
MPAKPKKKVEVEVGDLFVTESAVTVKLLPSKKSGSRPIRWFAGGEVSNIHLAAKDIAYLVGKVQGRTRVVRALTVMTDRGAGFDLAKTGLPKAIEKAGFEILR